MIYLGLGQTDYYPLIMIKPTILYKFKQLLWHFIFWHRCIFCEGSLHADLLVQSWKIVSLWWDEGSFYEICCSFYAISLFVACISNLISSINKIAEMCRVEMQDKIFKFTVAIRFKSYNILNFTLDCQNRKCFFWIIADFVICESISVRLRFHKLFSCHIIL